jgi:hypothetical protein
VGFLLPVILSEATFGITMEITIMAYFSQEKKKQMMPALKELCATYGVKASFGVNNHSTFECTIVSARINFLQDYASYNKTEGRPYAKVNEHGIEGDFKGESKEFLLKLKSIMMQGNWDNSDAMSDYFDVGWYINISIGKWDKHFIFDPSIKANGETKTVQPREPKPKKLIVRSVDSLNRFYVEF